MTSTPTETRTHSDWVIPLPKEIRASESVRVRARDTLGECSDRGSAQSCSAVNLLRAFCLSRGKPTVQRDGLLVIANYPLRLLFAARTLVQLTEQPSKLAATAELEIPLAAITDWPDIAERGQWGGDVRLHIAQVENVTDIMVRLSEERSPCFCRKCIGKEPYALEVDPISEAYREVRKSYPNVRLRILTAQGSYPVNDKILAAAPSDMGISYYDAQRT